MQITSTAVLVMNGSASTPHLSSFAAHAPERNARLVQSIQANPQATNNVFTHQLPLILSHARQGTRCFTYAVVDQQQKVVEANTYKQELLAWIHGGALAKDHAFVDYIKTYDPFRQHPIYISTKGGFYSAVIGLPGKLLDMLQHGPVQFSAEMAASIKGACNRAIGYADEHCPVWFVV